MGSELKRISQGGYVRMESRYKRGFAELHANSLWFLAVLLWDSGSSFLVNILLCMLLEIREQGPIFRH
jgi:hypothetical protein